MTDTSSIDPGLVDELAERINERILTGEFAVGTWLRQEALAAEFGVSRTPIREALRKLQADHFVELLPHRGALVRGPTAGDVREVFLIRADLEGLAAELGSFRFDADRLRNIREAEEAFRTAVATLSPDRRGNRRQTGATIATLAESDREFHIAVLESSGLTRLTRIASDLRRALPEAVGWAVLAAEPTLLDESVIQHSRIRSAVERGDAVAARRWMSDHVRRHGELMLTRFEGRTGSDDVLSGPTLSTLS